MSTGELQKLIEECRGKFGGPGKRKFSLLDRWGYMKVPKPKWCTAEDELCQFFKNQRDVFQYGVVVWGHIVQANSLLFEPGDDDCPASIIFCPSPAVQVDSSHLRTVASQLFQLKGTTPTDPELKKFADMLTDEMVRTVGLQVPSQLSRGIPLFEAATFICRKHLPPPSYLTGSMFPLVVSPKKPFYNFPLPARYWPKSLIRSWKR